MKHERLVTCLWAAALSLCAATGGVGCIYSAFGLYGVSFLDLLLCWILTAVVFSLCFTYRRGLYPLIGVGLLGGYLWWKGPLALSVERLVWDISQIYNNAYQCGTLRWSGESLGDISVNTALCWLGVLVVICVSATVVSRRSVWLGLCAAVLPLIPCLVVTDTVPGELYLFLMLLPTAVLLLTHALRHRDAAQANRLSLLLALPIILALGLLFLLVPREGYTGQSGAEKLENLVLELFSVEKTPEVSPPKVETPTPGSPLSEKVDLAATSPKSESIALVMRINAPVSGNLYLRGYSYDTYTGTSWESTIQRESGTHWPKRGELRYIGQLRISTVGIHAVRYLPYYPSNTEWYQDLWDGAVGNSDRLREYTVDWAVPQDPESYFDRITATEYGSDTDIYLRLPEQTRGWATMRAAQILREELPLSASEVTPAKVAAIADYVRSSAYYSLSTPRMPEGSGDFAQWFLEESDSGYCVHFATTTAVLMRAAGIPARYVTGYMVQAEAGENTPVRDMHAHAWVEYCLPGGVWQVLESTPAATEQPDPTLTPTEQPDPTDPTNTTATEPSGSEPGEPTQAPTLPTHQADDPGTTSAPTSQETPGTPRPMPAWLGRLLKGLLILLAAAGAVIGQWRLRVSLRQKRQHSGKANRRALARWQDIARMSRLLGKAPEFALYSLAQKARFSQHTLTPQELLTLEQGLIALQRELKKRRGPVQLLYTLVLALY